MSQVSVKTAVGFGNQAVAQIYVPAGENEQWVEDKIKKLQDLGLSALPGIKEASNQPIIHVFGKDPKTNRGYGEAELKSDITKAVGEVQYGSLLDEPPVNPPNSDFGLWLKKNLPWAYEKAGAIASALMYGGSFSLLQSAMPGAKPQKENEDGSKPKQNVNILRALSAGCFMMMYAVIGLFVRQPKNPRHVYNVFDDLQNEIQHKSADEVKSDVDQKDTFLDRAKENFRRFPWEIASLFGIPANALLALSTVTKESRERSDKWWTQTLVGLTMVGAHVLRVLTPQNGGETMLSKYPAFNKVREMLGIDDIDKDSELKKNPVNFTANMSLAAKVGGFVAGNITKDKGFAWSQPLSFAGMLFAKATSKAVGLGFDECITTGADFITKWDGSEICQDDKIKWIAKKLSKQPEIFHVPEDLEAGIRERLKQFSAISENRKNPTAQVVVDAGKKLQKETTSQLAVKDEAPQQAISTEALMQRGAALSAAG